MPNELFGRTYSLKGYDKTGQLLVEFSETMEDYEQLKLAFHITQHTSMINDIAQFSLYNLSDANKKKILLSTYFTFAAGYQGNNKMLFKGNLMNMFNQRPQPDMVTTIFTLDYIDQPIPVNLIIPTTMTDRQAIKTLGQTVEDLIVMDINLHDLKDVPIQKNISLVGLTWWQAFQKLGRLLNLNLWVTNRMLYSSSKTDGAPPANAPKIIMNYKNGMVGSPVFDVANAGVNVQSLLNGQLLPGSDVVIETVSPEVSFGAVNYANFSQDAVTRGTWRIFQTDHIGDSRGKSWYSEFQAYAYQPIILGVIPANE